MEGGEGAEAKLTLSRRDFLKKGALLGAGVAIGSGVGPSLAEAGLNLLGQADASYRDADAAERIRKQLAEEVQNVVPEDGPLEERELVGIRVFLNKDGLPVKFIARDGSEKKFDYDKVIAARERAKVTQESELISVVEMMPVEEKKEPRREYMGTPEHPIRFEPPQDALSREELQERGVEIIQGDDSNLLIRNSAFDEGNLMHSFSKGNKNLKIILVNGSIIDPYFLRDKKYDQVRDLIAGVKRQNAKEARRKELKYFQDYIGDLRQDIKKHRTGTHWTKEDREDSVSLSMRYLAKGKAFVYANQYFMSDVEVLVAHNAKRPHRESDAVGRYYSRSPITGKDNYIFSCVGKPELDTDMAWFYFKPDGEFDFSWSNGWGRALPFYSGYGEPHFGVNSSETFPDPDSYTVNPDASPKNPNSYPYAAQTAGLVLRHELAHAEMIGGKPVHKRNRSEYDTDMRAVDTIRDAWKRWKDSGFKDDSGYHFVLYHDEYPEYVYT